MLKNNFALQNLWSSSSSMACNHIFFCNSSQIVIVIKFIYMNNLIHVISIKDSRFGHIIFLTFIIINACYNNQGCDCSKYISEAVLCIPKCGFSWKKLLQGHSYVKSIKCIFYHKDFILLFYADLTSAFFYLNMILIYFLKECRLLMKFCLPNWFLKVFE